MWQHVWGEVGYFMTALLQVSRKMWQWKNFENRTVFDEVMCRLRWLTFFGPPCTWFRLIPPMRIGPFNSSPAFSVAPSYYSATAGFLFTFMVMGARTLGRKYRSTYWCWRAIIFSPCRSAWRRLCMTPCRSYHLDNVINYSCLLWNEILSTTSNAVFRVTRYSVL